MNDQGDSSTRSRYRRLAKGVCAVVIACLGLLLVFVGSGPTDPAPREPPAPTGAESVPSSLATIDNRTPLAEEDQEDDVSATRSLLGRVVSEQSGSSVAMARVSLTSSENSLVSMERAVRSDDEGLFSIEVPANNAMWGESSLHVLAEGYLPWIGGPEDFNRSSAGIPTFALAEGSSIEGRVMGHDGRPIEGAAVWASAQKNRVAWPHSNDRIMADRAGGARVRTDAQGRFVLPGLDQTLEYEVRAFAPLCGRPVLWPLVRGGATDVILTLRQSCLVELSFRSSSGLNIPASSVAIWRNPSTFALTMPVWSSEVADDRLSDSKYSRIHYTYIDPEQATHATEDEETLEVSVYAMGFLKKSIVVPIRIGSRIREEVVLEPDPSWSGMRSVVLEARLPSGVPLDGSMLFSAKGMPGFGNLLGVEFRQGVSVGAIPLPIGRHLFRPFWGGGRSLCAYAPASHPPLTVEVPPGEGSLRVPLVLQGDLVELEVLSPDGRIVRGFDLQVSGHGLKGGTWLPEWDADWHGSGLPKADEAPVLLLPPGDLTVTVNLPGVGGASGVVRGDGSGQKYKLSLVLDSAQEVPLRSMREAMVKHRRALSRDRK